MEKIARSKKIVALLLLIAVAFAFAGCGTANNLDEDGNYIVNENSVCAKIVGFILTALQRGLSYIHLYNYVFAIIALTLIVKIATTPLNLKQQKSMKAMQSMNPKMQEINLKYADDPQKKQEEMSKLYREANISPLSGCLPILIQMPILMVLFYGMRNWLPAQEIIDAGLYSFLWISDLSMTVKLTPFHWFLPIACALVTVGQQFLSSANLQDTSQKMMLLMMPVMFLFITPQFPSALAVYWLFYGFFSMLQVCWMNYRLKTGFFTPKEERVQNKSLVAEIKEKQEKKEQKSQSTKNARHVTTHNKSNTQSESQKTVQGTNDKRDKPWH
ncbi:MAG: YidC/Oxa1 family membrane protein insertase [Bacillota bacterium]|jgi:YidC/Oxa1 family membrane protein insertase